MPENKVCHSLPTVLDIEASKFDKEGFPVEVGFIRSDGFCYCCLIKPQSGWTNWDAEAEKVHGISRNILDNCGSKVKDVARILNQHLAGYNVYSENAGSDSAWLEDLFKEAEIKMEFKLSALPELLTDSQKTAWQTTRQRVEKMLGLRRHRASADARVIQMTFQLSADSQACNSQHVA
jgi:hypothetical protein